MYDAIDIAALGSILSIIERAQGLEAARGYGAVREPYGNVFNYLGLRRRLSTYCTDGLIGLSVR